MSLIKYFPSFSVGKRARPQDFACAQEHTLFHVREIQVNIGF